MIIQRCGETARVKILIIDVADDDYFYPCSEFQDYIDSEGNGLRLEESVIEQAERYNLPIMLIDASEKEQIKDFKAILRDCIGVFKKKVVTPDVKKTIMPIVGKDLVESLTDQFQREIKQNSVI